MKSRRRQRRRNRSSRLRTYGAVLLTVTLVLSVGGVWSALSVSHMDTARSGNVTVVEMNDPQAVVGVTSATSIQTGAVNQDFATIYNRLGSPATLVVELVPNDADANVSFVSTPSVAVSPDGTTATVSLSDNDATTVLVDVGENVSTSTGTVDFTISGATNDDRVSVNLNKQSGPTVTT